MPGRAIPSSRPSGNTAIITRISAIAKARSARDHLRQSLAQSLIAQTQHNNHPYSYYKLGF
jgi:hypothetical protein